MFSIPPGVPFVDALALTLLDGSLFARAAAAPPTQPREQGWCGGCERGDQDSDPLALTRTTVLLPTRRACRALRDAFLRAGDGAALLLPRLMPLGDVDIDEIELRSDEPTDETFAGDAALPPALPGVRRQLLLARLIFADGLADDADQAAQLARELARLLDQVATERLDFARLHDLVPEEYAAHWQKTLAFLAILTDRWPAVLRQEGALDAAARRDAVLAAQAELWRNAPPHDPVIAAGSTGSIPATADLMAVILGLPAGAIVLPGLDHTMSDDAWAALDPGHPQFGLKLLLERLGTARDAVALWPTRAAGSSEPARAAWLSVAMLPAASSDDWRRPETLPEAPLTGVTRIECANPHEEAGVIALALRETLERAGETAALVTPDRGLARRVAAELGRFEIAIDDSAGQPLDQSPPGVFLRLLAAAAAATDAPVPLLALLKHPLAAAGRPPGAFRHRVRQLEYAVLRGPRPGLTLAALAKAIGDDREMNAERRDTLARFVARVAERIEPLRALLERETVSLVELVRSHVAVAEALAASDDDAGAQRLWSGDAGEACATWIAELSDGAGVFPPVKGARYPALFDALIQGQVVRPRYGRHPRLQILGPLEARLQHADRVILGGLNEGTWPAEPPVDAWLSRPMREAFGLPAPERRIGLAAHDFAQAFCAREIVITRAVKVDGTPTVASRWLQRLDTVLQAGDKTDALAGDAPWLAWHRGYSAPLTARPWPAPEPRPPLAARPRKLSVTAIERWMRDPYEIYARHVLDLTRLDPLDADPGAADRGLFIHKALDAFARAYPDVLPADGVDRLLEIGRETFGSSLDRPAVWAFWWPRFERIASWFVASEAARRPTLERFVTECRGEFAIEAPGGVFTLTARADRIERRRDGELTIIDYKTGQPPTWPDVASGLSPQLPLEAVIARAGGFADLAAAPIAALVYWRLSGGDPPGEIKPLDEGRIDSAIEAAARGVAALIARFDDPATGYPSMPRPDKAPKFSDYMHLARVREWSGGEEPE
ncbi:MAG: double-strand break repair protein AddB [Proteobacteria bacterium]|nr:double-strand break repair protein AddB [Pseudomonadota bacterium]